MRALDGKVVAVTGASSGSGLGVARRFVAEGAKVVLLARGKERLERVAAELGKRAAAIATDVGDPDSVRTAFEHIDARFGKLDVLVNNAAIYRPCAVEHLGVLVGVDTDDDVELLCERELRSLNRGVPVVGSGPSAPAAGL